jgi:hypothetical protein
MSNRALMLTELRGSCPCPRVTMVHAKWEAAMLEVRVDTTERNTVIAACIMILIVLLAWNLPIARDIISGLKAGGVS